MYCLEKLNPSSARSARPTWEGSTWPRSRLRGLQPLQVAMLCLLAWTSTLSDITNTSGDFHLSVNKMFLVIVGASWNHSRMVLRWASAPTPTAWRIGGWLLGTTGSLTASTCRQPGITFWLALWRGMLCKSEWPSSYINPLHRCSPYDPAEVLERAAPLPADLRADIERYVASIDFCLVQVADNCVGMTWVFETLVHI